MPARADNASGIFSRIDSIHGGFRKSTSRKKGIEDDEVKSHTRLSSAQPFKCNSRTMNSELSAAYFIVNSIDPVIVTELP